MADYNLTPSTSALTDREINQLFDASLDNLHLLSSWKLIPFVKEIKGDWDEVIETVENGKDGTDWIADEESPKSGTIGSGYRTVISSKEFGNAFTLTRKTQEKFKATGDPRQKEKFKAHLDGALADVLEGMIEFIDRKVGAMVSDAFAGTNYKSLEGSIPVISASHAYKSGQTFSNLITVNSTVNKEFGYDVLEYFETTGARIDTPDGKKAAYKPDTIVVPYGTSVARAAKEILGFTQFTPTTINDVNIYQNGVKGYNLIEIATLGIDEDGNDLAYRDTLYFVYSSKFDSKPVYTVNFPTEMQTTYEQDKSNLTKYWRKFGTIGLGVSNLPVGLYGSKGTNVA